jgi:hypothetical protein
LFIATDEGYDVDGVIVCPENVLAAITGVGRKAIVNGRGEARPVFDAHFFNRASNAGEGYALQVYPNPSEGKVYLNLNSTSGKQILVQVFDLTGKAVRSFSASTQVGTNQLEVNLSDTAKGLYLIKVSTESGSWSKTVKVVKE